MVDMNVPNPAQLAAAGVISEDAAADMAASAQASADDWRKSNSFSYSAPNIESDILYTVRKVSEQVSKSDRCHQSKA